MLKSMRFTKCPNARLTPKAYATSSMAMARPVRAVRCFAFQEEQQAQPLKREGGRHRAPLIDRLGGPDTVKLAVDKFYTKVLADDRVNHYFQNTDMNKQRAHQAAFMTYAFGGPQNYKGKDMAEAHMRLDPPLNDQHFDAIVEHFVSTLEDMGVEKQDIDDAVLVVASTKSDVLAK